MTYRHFRSLRRRDCSSCIQGGEQTNSRIGRPSPAPIRRSRTNRNYRHHSNRHSASRTTSRRTAAVQGNGTDGSRSCAGSSCRSMDRSHSGMCRRNHNRRHNSGVPAGDRLGRRRSRNRKAARNHNRRFRNIRTPRALVHSRGLATTMIRAYLRLLRVFRYSFHPYRQNNRKNRANRYKRHFSRGLPGFRTCHIIMVDRRGTVARACRAKFHLSE
jgi:hypothetical protein